MNNSNTYFTVLVVAVGPSVLFYRNMKPYFKFTVPSSEIDAQEVDIWRKFSFDRRENIPDLIEQLRNIEINHLTITSQMLLNISDDEERRDDYIAQRRDIELKRFSPIAALNKIYRHAPGDQMEKAVNCLVIATENGEIFILDCQTFTILHHAKTNSNLECPVMISANGQFDQEFTIVTATRQGHVSILRRGWLEGKNIIRLDEPVTGLSLMPVDQTIVFVCMDRSLQCYSKKGKRLWTVTLPAPAICMTPIALSHLGLTLVCVALEGGQVQLYSAKKLVDEFFVPVTVGAIIFGRLGQEDHVLALNTIDGAMMIKILKRTANFHNELSDQGKVHQVMSTEQLNSLIPKKNKIFVEQMDRERENASAIYQHFQVEMWKMRLLAAKSTLDVIVQAETTLSGDIGYSSIKLAAEVLGYGPEFILKLKVENLSVRQVAAQLCILLHANRRHYKLNQAFVYLPPLLPNFPIKLDFDVTCETNVDDGMPPPDLTPENATIKCIIFRSGQVSDLHSLIIPKNRLFTLQAKPLLAATISMPMMEPARPEETNTQLY